MLANANRILTRLHLAANDSSGATGVLRQVPTLERIIGRRVNEAPVKTMVECIYRFHYD